MQWNDKDATHAMYQRPTEATAETLRKAPSVDASSLQLVSALETYSLSLSLLLSAHAQHFTNALFRPVRPRPTRHLTART